MKLIRRIQQSLAWGYVAWKNPLASTSVNMQSLVNLYDMILKTAESDHPQASHIGFVNLDTGEEIRIVTVWAAPTIDGNPMDRIQELLKENALLRIEMRKKNQERLEEVK